MTYEPKNAYRTRTCRTERYLKDVVFLKEQHLTHARARVRARGKQFERPYGPCHGPCAPPLRGGDWWPGRRGYAPQSSPPRGANGPQGLRAPRNRLWPIPHLRTRQLVRRPVAVMMCSAGYGVRSAQADRSPTGPAPTASPRSPLDSGASTSSSRGTACGSRRPRKPAFRKGRGA